METARAAVLATGASEPFSRCLVQLLRSVERTQDLASLRVLIHDLGLHAATRAKITARFAFAEWSACDLAASEDLFSYAWKPRIFRALLERSAEPVLWLDSATVLCAPLEPVYAYIRATGLYTPRSGSGRLAERTHPTTLTRLDVPEAVRRQRFVAGGVFGADPRSQVAERVVEAWARWATDSECLAPQGATHTTHRYDQSLLSIAVYTLAGETELTRDELDISSARPCGLYRTRNKIAPWLPWWTDPWLRAGFALLRSLDVAGHRLRQAGQRERALLSPGRS